MSEITDIERTYSIAAEAAGNGWEVTEVSWPAFEVYHQAVKELEQCLRAHDIMEEWAGFLSFCKRYRFFLTTTPLPPAVLLAEILNWQSVASPPLQKLLVQATDTVKEQVGRTQEAFDQLQQERENPLWEAALSDIRTRNHENVWIGVVCGETRLIEPVRSFLEAHEEETVWLWAVRPIELKATETYGQLIVLGPTQRFISEGTDYLFKSPRASILTLFTPDFFSARIPAPHDLLGSPHRGGSDQETPRLSQFTPPTINKCTKASPEGVLPPEHGDEKEWIEALPKLNITYKPRVDGAAGTGDEVEPVSAKQLVLTADHVVYLPEGGNVSRLCVDLESKHCTDVEHVDVATVGAGDVLLFSAEGGGDMVAEVADRLLGDEAVPLRGLQRLWKSALGAKVASKGLTGVVRELKEYGSRIASRPNLRHWCSMWNIGPGTWRSFEAILRYCDLEGSQDDIFEATDRIRQAHRRAGFELSRRLQERMIGESLEQLYSEGRQEFGGTAALPNRKIVFLVIEVSADSLEVFPYDILEPFAIHQKSWR